MKLCFFIGYYPFVKGGAEYQSKLIAEELSKEHDIFFISVSNNHIANEVIHHDEFKVYQLNYNLLLNKATLYYPLAWEINRILKNERPDAIYQRILNSFSYHLSQYANNRSIPHYIHVADKYSLLFDGKNLSTYIRKYLFNGLNLATTKFITQNREQTKLLNNLKIAPVLQIYNMHPVPDFSYNECLNSKIQARIKSIVWIGSSRPVKRLELYLELAKLCENLKDFRFYIIGRIEEGEYGFKLMETIESLKNVEYLGEQENSFVNNFLEKEAYLTLNTSKSEGFSNVFIQSWLRGVPVYSLNSSPDDLFDSYKLGRYFNDDFDELKNSLLDFNANNDYLEMANECLKVSRELFSLEKSIGEIKAIL
ncbi:glycosyltransferase family 4 protein [Sphingobacterium athyrii]|uniref:Glycosyl transferase family 1 domain-containing protein n=1 Tax=Sphingobacterium athyrii TaxID=2152717 RepID=A0A363NQ70_9SPHI|nr:glycosyltransferase [Sphingobacterium athyrii]PUV22942.1 hypothetical protein DCO56_18650 [Sphingobacterium athyrii]